MALALQLPREVVAHACPAARVCAAGHGPGYAGSRDPGARRQLRREEVITSYLDAGHRVPRYWSITTTSASPLARKVCASKKQAACRWMYTVYESGTTELYDISNGPCHEWRRKKRGDPCMLKNKAGKQPYRMIQRTLREELERRVPGF
jgi:hypothetical protein